MLVFLTWSGPESRQVSAALRDFLPRVLQAVVPWVSYDGIPTGAVWTVELEQKLDASDAGIICVTPTNLKAPWLHYETGKLSKTKARVCPYLFRVTETHLEGGLTNRQAVTEAEDKPQNKKLVLDLAALLREKEGSILRDDQVTEQFEVWWPSLEKALKAVTAEPAKQRGERELVEEVLLRVRSIEGNVEVRIPAQRERSFRPNVSTDSGDVSSRSGHVSTDSGAPEHRFR